MVTLRCVHALKSWAGGVWPRFWCGRAPLVAMLLMVMVADGLTQRPTAAAERPAAKAAPGKSPATPRTSAAAADTSVIPPMPDPVDMLRQEIQGKLADQAKLTAKLREDIDNLSQDLRTNSKSIEELKAKMEENAILVYEHLSRGMARAEAFEQMRGRLDVIEGRLGMRGKRLPAPPPLAAAAPGSSSMDSAPYDGAAVRMPSEVPAGVPSKNPADSGAGLDDAGTVFVEHGGEPAHALAAVPLLLIVLLGLSLVEMSRLEAWALPQAALRNLLITAAATLAYFTIGHGIMFGELLFSEGAAQADADSVEAFRLYRLGWVLVATLVVSTILSDRLSLPAYGFLAMLFGGLAYPLFGHWIGGGPLPPEQAGGLQRLGFQDFAGATVIHSFAAWFAVGWLWRFPMTRPIEPDVKPADVNAPPHQALVLLGAFLLWLGWFGFSIGAPEGDGHPAALSALNTLLAGAAALLASLVYLLTPPDIPGAGSVLTRLSAGMVAGLVAVSAGLHQFEPAEAIAVGAMAGLVQPLAYQLLSTKLFQRDQVAALLIAVHGVCGVFGTLCVALFGGSAGAFRPEPALFGTQALGILLALVIGLLTGVLGSIVCAGVSRLNAVRPGAFRCRD